MCLKLLIISCFGYPNPTNLYNSGFVHSRALAYKKEGYRVKVFVPDTTVNSISGYQFEGIDVLVGNILELEKELLVFTPDRLLIHFINRHVIKLLNKIKFSLPIVVWVHGYEALAWYRLFFEYKSLKQFSFMALTNTRQLIYFHKFVKQRKQEQIIFIFVSEWMQKVASADTLLSIHNYKIIPNPIDSNLFSYQIKSVEARKQILLIRPFTTRKYANDQAVKAILSLTQESCFKDLTFTIVGQGTYFTELTNPLKIFSNVKLINRFYTQSEIATAHKTHGVFLCPTRMDAQGVSMCEAMMSGLVPIASNNTAIPEYVQDKVSGFLTNNYQEIANSILYLYHNPESFLEMSSNAHVYMKNKAGHEKVIKQELDVIKTIN